MDTEVHDVGAIEDENVKPKRPNMNVSDADAATPAKRRRKKDPSEIELEIKQKEEAKRLREEAKAKQRLEEEAKKEEARRLREEAKAKQRLEEEAKKEEARRLRKAQKEQDQKAKEEARILREKAKEDNRKAKEEAKRVREQLNEQKRLEHEEAKRLREEKKREREEESRLRLEKVKAAKAKEERQSSSFVSYFSKVDTKEPKTWGWSNEVFKPFQIKEKVVIAPIHRRDPLSDDCHNCLLSISLEKSDYLKKAKKIKRERVVKKPMRAKYFHFHSNNRPPYYGTWRKISRVISGRRPFAMSHNELHYDIDSDAEWEEEQAEGGDDCLSDADDGINEDSNETSDDFCVDHGYLSENEGSEASDADPNEDSNERKRRLNHRAREFTKQRSNKSLRVTKKMLTTQIYGLCWNPPQSAVSELRKRLIKAVVFDFTDIKQ